MGLLLLFQRWASAILLQTQDWGSVFVLRTDHPHGRAACRVHVGRWVVLQLGNVWPDLRNVGPSIFGGIFKSAIDGGWIVRSMKMISWHTACPCSGFYCGCVVGTLVITVSYMWCRYLCVWTFGVMSLACTGCSDPGIFLRYERPKATNWR